ncbi:helix-hairpin-helix domain-containing protein [Natronococcus sp. JC468]|uniref:helix-hairpin-helix domain-containing protein n=1 Tax=Natronococcus sp. JC468 TaxID=1961921 RepID=UPI00143A29FB|nr:helix-hairpin-helix domain-containing protein [Natronococcus sp. JC468]NKE36839.1 helix-hairpin-helix domain-containing protein [Natronococcus sp. JC468]
MAILQKLKSLLGFDDSDSERGDARDVGVTVERERGAGPGEESAAAETAASASPGARTAVNNAPQGAAEPAEATGPDQSDAAPTESKVPDEEDVHDEEFVDDAEPEAGGVELEDPSDSVESADTDDADEDGTETEPASEAKTVDDSAPDSGDALEEAEDATATDGEESSAESDEADGEPSDTPDEPVDVIKGIGPAYADRLADAGVETVAELAAADAAALESETDISEKRIQGWIDRAKVR